MKLIEGIKPTYDEVITAIELAQRKDHLKLDMKTCGVVAMSVEDVDNASLVAYGAAAAATAWRIATRRYLNNILLCALGAAVGTFIGFLVF